MHRLIRNRQRHRLSLTVATDRDPALYARRRRRSRGQSLVEFALVLPVLLLVVLIAIDFGRAFLSVISVTNASRIGASYAAGHPDGTFGPGSDFEKQITDEWAPLGCELATPVSAPVFPDGNVLSGRATVSLRCDFALLTPIIGSILPNPLPITATTTYRIRTGVIAGTPSDPSIPTPTPSPTPSPTPTPTPEPTETPTPDPSASPTPTPTPTPTPEPTPCMATVPQLVGLTQNAGRSAWTAAGFTGTFKAVPDKGSNIIIKQDLVSGGVLACSSNISVNTANP